MFTSRQDKVLSKRSAGTNAPVSIQLVDGKGKHSHISRVIFSYSATPMAGRLTIVGPEDTFLDIPITAGGPGPLGLNIRALRPLTILLAAGGSGVEGALYVEYFDA